MYECKYMILAYIIEINTKVRLLLQKENSKEESRISAADTEQLKMSLRPSSVLQAFIAGPTFSG